MTQHNVQDLVTLTKDPCSPYYLHHSDNDFSVVVTPELTTSNYSKWSRSFLLELSARNKLGFVTGAIPCPNVNDPLHSAWNRCNDLIVSWLRRSISPPIASTIFHLTSAAQIWSVLKKRFAQPDDARICHLQQRLCMITQGNKSVDAYFNELNSTWKELKLYRPLPYCSCGNCNVEQFVGAHEKDVVLKFLNGLNVAFRNIRSQIVMMQPFPSLDEAYNLVLSEESQRGYGNNFIATNVVYDAPALAFQGSKARNSNLMCTNCKKRGHTRENCYFLIGFPQKGNTSNDSSSGGNMGFRGRKPQLINNVISQEDHTESTSTGAMGNNNVSKDDTKEVAKSDSIFSRGVEIARQMEQWMPVVNQVLSLVTTTSQSKYSSQPGGKGNTSNNKSSRVNARYQTGFRGRKPRVINNVISREDHTGTSSIISKGVEYARQVEKWLPLVNRSLSLLMTTQSKYSSQHVATSSSTADNNHLAASLSSFKVLSYNVSFSEGLEVPKRMKAIGDLIQLHSPEMICFQEVTPTIFELFQQSSWWKAYCCSLSNYLEGLRPYFCMLLSKLPVKSFSRRPFGNSIMGRELCIAELQVQDNKTLVVATSHLESPSPTPPKWDQKFSKERVTQANEAIDFLKKYPNVIFGGDMNWDDKLDGHFPLLDGWVDAWKELKPGDNGWTYDTKSNQMLTANWTLQKRLDRFICNLSDFKISGIDMIGKEPIPGLMYIKEKKVRQEVKLLELPVLPSNHYGLLLTVSQR